MEQGKELVQRSGDSIRVLVLWRELWSPEAANKRSITDLGLDESRVWITVYQG